MIEIIKFILYLITVIFVVFNILDNVLIESIKARYSYVPGKFSKFGKAINFLQWTIVVTSLMMFPFNVRYIFSEKLSSSNNSGNSLINNTAFISTFLLVLNVIITIWLYYSIKKMLISKLEKSERELHDSSMINLFGIKLSIKIDNKVDFKNIKLKLLRFNTVSSYINVGLYVLVTGYFTWILRNELDKYSEGVLIFASMLIISSIISIISSSINKSADEIRTNKKYIFICGDNDSIITDLYLDYKDDYLIIKNGQEIFIPKSTVKRKVVRHIK